MPRPAPPATDARFTFGLTLDVAKVLETWGYPKITAGGDFVELQMMLFLFIYGPSEAADAAAIGSPAVTAALSTMDMLARVPAVQARLAREGITSLDEPAPYLPAGSPADAVTVDPEFPELLAQIRAGEPAFVPTQMPTGDEANRATAEILRARGGRVRYGNVRSLPDGAFDEFDGRGDAEMFRAFGPGPLRGAGAASGPVGGAR